ncbi:CCHC-type domain-containing protein [Aphis craccivora]|uniref:CCHC-type domain-containing protein n=1 Tax=Aphis craccivora TaxID=307492 RepID=A0A6G0VX46_APHCR|nr:CCHC-type domain-containing protein [Aphis craccivora]
MMADGTLLIAKRKITTKMYKDFIPQLDISIDWKTKYNTILNNSIIPDKGNPIVKKNSFKLIEYSKSLEELKYTKTSSNIMDTIGNGLYIIITIIIISIGLVITIILYLTTKNKHCKTSNCVKNSIESKVYETVNTPNHDNPLPKIIYFNRFCQVFELQPVSERTLLQQIYLSDLTERNHNGLRPSCFELHSSKQKPKEDVIAYSTRIESLQILILEQKTSGKSAEVATALENSLKAQTIQVFIEFLGKLKDFIKDRNPPTLEKAIQAAREEERVRRSLAESKRFYEGNG